MNDLQHEIVTKEQIVYSSDLYEVVSSEIKVEWVVAVLWEGCNGYEASLGRRKVLRWAVVVVHNVNVLNALNYISKNKQKILCYTYFTTKMALQSK